MGFFSMASWDYTSESLYHPDTMIWISRKRFFVFGNFLLLRPESYHCEKWNSGHWFLISTLQNDQSFTIMICWISFIFLFILSKYISLTFALTFILFILLLQWVYYIMLNIISNKKKLFKSFYSLWCTKTKEFSRYHKYGRIFKLSSDIKKRVIFCNNRKITSFGPCHVRK